MISRTTEPMLMAPLEIEKWFFSTVFFFLSSPSMQRSEKTKKNREKRKKNAHKARDWVVKLINWSIDGFTLILIS